MPLDALARRKQRVHTSILQPGMWGRRRHVSLHPSHDSLMKVRWRNLMAKQPRELRPQSAQHPPHMSNKATLVTLERSPCPPLCLAVTAGCGCLRHTLITGWCLCECVCVSRRLPLLSGEALSRYLLQQLCHQREDWQAAAQEVVTLLGNYTEDRQTLRHGAP